MDNEKMRNEMLNISINYKASINSNFVNVRSEDQSLSYNGAQIVFRVSLVPREDVTTENSNGIEVNLECRRKPQKDVKTQLQLTIIKNNKRKILHETEWIMTGTSPSLMLTTLPESLIELEQLGFLSINKRCIHVIIDVQIMKDELKRTVAEMNGHSGNIIVDETGLELYKSPNKQRKGQTIKFISADKVVMHIDKVVLEKMSQFFREKFQAKTNQQSYTFPSLNAKAMDQMKWFLYTKQTRPNFHEFAQIMLPVAEQFEMYRLKAECVRNIKTRVDEMDFDEIFHNLNLASINNCQSLKYTLMMQLAELMKYSRTVDEHIIKRCLTISSHQNTPVLMTGIQNQFKKKIRTVDDRNNFKELVKICRRHQFEDLRTTCAFWYKNHFEELKKIGFVEELYQDPEFRVFLLDMLAKL